jgi:hypothetical protein
MQMHLIANCDSVLRIAYFICCKFVSGDAKAIFFFFVSQLIFVSGDDNTPFKNFRSQALKI